MSVLRAILGRFARFLVRIARTLDPGVGPAPYWVMPERMAALRLRYPGAPEHWLETLARRTSLGDASAAPAYRAEPEPRAESPRPRFGVSGPNTDAIRPGARPAPRFPAAIKIARAIARPVSAESAPRPVAEAPRAAVRDGRPMLFFGAARVRNPIANLLRAKPSNDRRDEPRFDDGRPSPAHDAHLPPADRSDARREHAAVFTTSDQHSAHPVEWIGPRQPQHSAPPRDSTPSWPEFRYSVPPGPSWPNEGSRQSRYNPRFATPDNRWPELPPFLDEPGASGLRASDEAALLAEQMGGKWSA